MEIIDVAVVAGKWLRVSLIAIIMKRYIFFGNTGTGKTSTHNTLNSLLAAPVGGGGDSTTKQVFQYTLPKGAIFPNETSVFVDTPGLFDSEIQLTNDKIMDIIRIEFTKDNATMIDGVILVVSVAESTLQVQQTYRHALELFGPVARSSFLVLATMWDDIQESELRTRKRQTLTKMCNEVGLKWVEWINKTDSRISEWNPQMHGEQMAKLKDGLQSLTSFQVSEMQRIVQQIQERAERIRGNDRDRYGQRVIQVVVDGQEVYTKPRLVYQSVPRYKTNEQINQRAQQISQARSYTTTKYRTEQRSRIVERRLPRRVPRVVTQDGGACEGSRSYTVYDDIIVTDRVTENYNEQVPYNVVEYHPWTNFINEARSEQTTVQVTVNDQFTRPVKKTISKPEQYEKHEFSYYQNLAREELTHEALHS